MSNYAVVVEVVEAVVVVEVLADCLLSVAELWVLSYSLAPGTY